MNFEDSFPVLKSCSEPVVRIGSFVFRCVQASGEEDVTKRVNLDDIRDKVTGVCYALAEELPPDWDDLPEDIFNLADRLETLASITRLASAKICGYAGYVRGKANEIFKEDNENGRK